MVLQRAFWGQNDHKLMAKKAVALVLSEKVTQNEPYPAAFPMDSEI